MRGIRRYGLRLGVVAALMLLLATMLGGAYSAFGGDTGNVISACINRYTGTVRMAPSGGSINCSPQESAVQWNSQGVPGP